MGNTILQKGSQGDDVKEVQSLLRNLGYDVRTTGVYDDNTVEMVKRYQESIGLAEDGIAGNKTLSALTNGKGLSNTVNTPPTYTAPTYKESDVVTSAKNALDAQLANRPGYTSQWQTQLNDTINKILNREKFSYDLNGDALYQQYKDKYIQQGKLAMGDAIGQASAMTGGYGNSYAQSVGQQAYQAQLQNLNDIVPELYQMAYDRYNQEGDDLYKQYSMLGAEEDRDYGKYRDKMSDYFTNRDYLTDRYYSERDFDYSKYIDNRDFGYDSYRDAVSDYQWDTSFEYQKDRDEIADEQWEKEYALNALKGGYTVDKSGGTEVGGNLIPIAPTTPEIPNSVVEYAKSFESNEALANWAYGLADEGTITEEQADQLIADNMDYNEKYIKDDKGNKTISYKDMIGSTNGWTVIKKGGGNLVGIDRNAVVKAPDGKEYKLIDLKQKLIDEGMKDGDAQDAIKWLQQKLKISSNWLFGW